MTDKLTKVMEKGMDSCHKRFRKDPKTVNKCIVGVAVLRGKIDKVKTQITEDGFKKAIDLIIIDELSRDTDWNDIIGKPDSFEQLGATCIGGENLTDCALRAAKRYSASKFRKHYKPIEWEELNE